ncbi:formamidopyrimidine-DNA glycosylase [candidate division KSB3 bacterium]|uniref:Formamidopyrimidine-DNA glycosylase n=1 Tax=candidate division KSB3 bacterium TaxID=2044937 RepID=A0A2G6EE41_9BACT|nr:MAG: formamidopyrimidine-DNA glycosylase [candidate division KSB3 bacterium]PIE31024.1 MAG: formamidopyrimidine-DNA glycosylase [candidate division KSB3 bacterium]
MPELPEVQTVVNDLNAAGLVGLSIRAAEVFWQKTVAPFSPEEFSQQLCGHVIQHIWRRAKYIVWDLDQGAHILIHLRMSGRLELVETAQNRKKHEHVIFHLSDGRQLRFHDTRKFGRILLVTSLRQALGHLGPEPLRPEFTAQGFHDALHQRKRQMKPLLLDQTFLAGLGNIYVDEALWEARIHPKRLSSSLSEHESHSLHKAIRNVLNKGLINLGTTLGTGKANFYSVGRRQGHNSETLNVFRRNGLPCPRCDTPIERLIVGQRSTHICPLCQKTST